MSKTMERNRAGPGGGRGAPELQESATPSPTAVAAEAQRTGVVPLTAEDGRDGASHDDRMRGADARDDRALDTEDVGDHGPGGSMLSPDLNSVDAVGRAAGVQEEDSGELRTSSEILDRRDQHRAQKEVPDPNPER